MLFLNSPDFRLVPYDSSDDSDGEKITEMHDISDNGMLFLMLHVNKIILQIQL